MGSLGQRVLHVVHVIILGVQQEGRRRVGAYADVRAQSHVGPVAAEGVLVLTCPQTDSGFGSGIASGTAPGQIGTCYMADRENPGGGAMKAKLTIAVFGLGSAVSVTPGLAHHSVPAQFDVDRETAIRGVVTRIEWANPHARLWVDAKNDDGTVSGWEMELPPPNALKREVGNLDFVKQGDQVSASLWRAKDGSRVAHALTLTTPDGRVMSFPRNGGWLPSK